MFREFYSVVELRARYPGRQALILQSPVGERLLLKLQDKAPEGKWCLLGMVDYNG